MEFGKTGTVTHDPQKYSRYHDLRLYKDGEWPEHIDRSRTENNVIFASKTLEDVYVELYDKSVEDFNAKQTRDDRKRAGGGLGYLKELQEKLKNAKDPDKAIKPAFQLHIEVGDWYDTSYDNAPDDAKQAEQILMEYWDGFEKRNPHMMVAWAVLHRDESKPGIHATMVPWCNSYVQGMPVRTSMSGALEQQGFVDEKNRKRKEKDTAWERWLESERKTLENIMRKYGLNPIRKNDEHREKLTKAEYKSREHSINATINRELEKVISSPLVKMPKADGLLGMVNKRDYDALYNDYLRVGGKARAAQELIRRTDKKQIDSLLQQLELSHKTQERLRELIDRMEKEIVREKVKNDELIGKLNLLQSANVKDLTPERNKAVNHTKGHNRTL